MSRLTIPTRARLLRAIYAVGNVLHALRLDALEMWWLNGPIGQRLFDAALESPAVGVTYAHYDFERGTRFVTHPPSGEPESGAEAAR